MKINLITGSTGFVGNYLVKRLLNKGEVVWVIVRELDNEKIETRINKKFSGYVSNKNFKVIKGNILYDNLGIKKSEINILRRHEVTFWHLAANLSFSKKDKDSIIETNITGTQKCVDFANKIAKKMIHVSTIYVCGNKTLFKETDFNIEQKHRNYYEQTKFFSEKIVREKCAVDYTIFRPSIIIGDAYTGKAEGCTFGYYRYIYIFYFLKNKIIKTLGRDTFMAKLLKLFKTKNNKGKISAPWLIIPYAKKGTVNIVTIDYVISVLESLSKNSNKDRTIHIINEKPPSFHFMLNSILEDVGFEKYKLIPISNILYYLFIKSAFLIIWPLRKYIKSIMQYTPYITTNYNFENKTTKKHKLDQPEINRDKIRSINYYAINEIMKNINFD